MDLQRAYTVKVSRDTHMWMRCCYCCRCCMMSCHHHLWNVSLLPAGTSQQNNTIQAKLRRRSRPTYV